MIFCKNRHMQTLRLAFNPLVGRFRHPVWGAAWRSFVACLCASTLAGGAQSAQLQLSGTSVTRPDAEVAQAPTATPPSPRPNQAAPIAAWGKPRERVRFFVSGHSLTDDPFAEHVEAIALSLGGPQAARHNQQIVIGSPIGARTGMPASLDRYATGKNRKWTNNMDVLRELSTGATIGGDRYDTLVITENHNLLDMLQWENSLRQLRHYHDRLIEAQPAARTFLYSSWWDIDRKQPQTWVDAERVVGKAWQCVGSRINRSLQHEGRADRITPLPASLALVELVDRVQKGRLPEIAAAGSPDALNRIFTDNVHLTPMGSYYMSLVTYAAIFERSPVGGFRPAEVSEAQARVLQALAWEFVSQFYARYSEPSLEECNAQTMPQVCRSYFGLRNKAGQIGSCIDFFKPENAENPMRFNAASDRRYWFPSRP